MQTSFIIGGAVLPAATLRPLLSHVHKRHKLVSQLTDTNPSKISVACPEPARFPSYYCLSVFIYAVAGTFMGGSGTVPDAISILFRAHFVFSRLVPPAILVVVLALEGRRHYYHASSLLLLACICNLCSACPHPGAPQILPLV